MVEKPDRFGTSAPGQLLPGHKTEILGEVKDTIFFIPGWDWTDGSLPPLILCQVTVRKENAKTRTLNDLVGSLALLKSYL